MRILTIIDSLAVGGAERSLAALAPFLVERGVEIHVAHLLNRPGVDDDLRRANVTLHSLSGRWGRVGSLIRAIRLIRSVSPSLVHTTLFESDLAGRTAGWLLGVPVVSSLVSEPYGPEHIYNPEYRPWKVRAAQLADVVTARLVTRFHAVSTSVADLMVSRLRIPRAKIDVIPRARNPAQLGVRSPERRQAARADLGVEVDQPLVLAAGRHAHVKGFDLLIEAFSAVVTALPSAHLLVAGREGPATTDMKRLIWEKGLEESVTLAGVRSDLPDLMCAADVFVFSSLSEGSPGVLLEAMALETPVVARDIPSVREIAGTGKATMVLTPFDSPEEMSMAIVELCTDHRRARDLTGAARNRFMDNFTIDAIAEATVEFYKRSIPNR